MFRQYLACKSLPAAPTPSARSAEQEQRETHTVSSLVNRPNEERLRVHAGWLQKCSLYEQMTQQASCVLTLDDGTPDKYLTKDEAEVYSTVDFLCNKVSGGGSARGAH